MLVTVADIYRYFLEGINKGNAGTVTPDEFPVIYNAAAVDFVQHRARTAERDQRALDDLRALVPPPEVIANAGNSVPEEERFPLPYTDTPSPGESHGYLHALSVAFKVVDESGRPAECSRKDRWAVARIMRRDFRYDSKRDPFKRPVPWKPRYWITGNDVMVSCGDGYHATDMQIEYVKYPVAISVTPPIDPGLPPDTNQQIADYAIRRYLENIESRRAGTFLQERRVNA